MGNSDSTKIKKPTADEKKKIKKPTADEKKKIKKPTPEEEEKLKFDRQSYKKLPWETLPYLHVIYEFLRRKQAHIPDTEPMLKKEHLLKFSKRNGGGFAKNAKYIYVVTIQKQIRFAVIKDKKGKNPFEGKKYRLDAYGETLPVGHTSLLPKRLYDLAYNMDVPEEERAVAKYSGSFWTDKNGAITQWDNDSGHFQPYEDHHVQIQEILHLPETAEFVAPINSRKLSQAHQQLLDMFGDESYYYQSGAAGIYNHYGANLDFMPNMAMERSDNDYYSHSQQNIGYYYNVNQMFENGIGAVIIFVAIIFLFCITCMVSMVCGVVFGYRKTKTQSSKSEMRIVVD